MDGTILIADGSAGKRRIVIQAMREAGRGDHRFLEASDESDALARLSESNGETRLVFLGWSRNALSALKAIRSHPSTRGIPVIVLARESDRTQLVDAIRAGATNWLVEPFDRRAVQEKVEAALAD